MVYKMDKKQGTFARGDNGIGKIRFSSNSKKVNVILNVPTGKDNFTKKSYIVDVEGQPDNIELARDAKELMIQMSSTDDWTEKNGNLIGGRIMSFRPTIGAFVVTTKAFAAKEGEEPAPKTKEGVGVGKGGKQYNYSYEYFTVILSIVEGKFKGLDLPLVLHYNFSPFDNPDGKTQRAGYSMGGKYTDALNEYLFVAGILEDKYQPMKWKDNLLPDLQRIALHEGRRFQLTMKDGWIVSGSLIPYDEPDESIPFDTDSDEVPIEHPAPESKFEPEGDFEPDDDDEITFEPSFE